MSGDPPTRSHGDVLLLDGATGTELERAGVDIGLPLWSARAVLAAPDAVRAVHEAYLRAGARAITTATFRTTERTLAREGLADRAGELTARAVTLADEARRRVRSDALVLGSVAPLEECYAPQLAPDAETCAREHERIMRRLLDAGVDLLLLETMGTRRESLAAAEVAERLAPGRWMIGFCTADERTLLDGTPVAEVARACVAARAVGVNCVAAPATEAVVRTVRAALPPSTAIMAYANIGVADADGNWICTDAIEPERYADYAVRWIDAGATIVGGCCGTRPAHIAAMARRLQ